MKNETVDLENNYSEKCSVIKTELTKMMQQIAAQSIVSTND